MGNRVDSLPLQIRYTLWASLDIRWEYVNHYTRLVWVTNFYPWVNVCCSQLCDVFSNKNITYEFKLFSKCTKDSLNYLAFRSFNLSIPGKGCYRGVSCALN